MTATPSPPAHRAPLRPRRLFGSLSHAAQNAGGKEGFPGAKAGRRSGGGAAPRRWPNHHHHLHASSASSSAAVWTAAGSRPRSLRPRARAYLTLAALLALASTAVALAWRAAGEAALAAAARPGLLLARPPSVRVLDGDTLDVARVRIRLLHMDAPEGEQACGGGGVWARARWPVKGRRAGGSAWACGDAATAALARLVHAAAWVECTPRGRDRYGRTLAACEAVGRGPAWWAVAGGGARARVSLAAWMVERGWAVAYGAPRASGLKALEGVAKAGGRGVWADARFERPAAWRKRVKQQQQA